MLENIKDVFSEFNINNVFEGFGLNDASDVNQCFEGIGEYRDINEEFSDGIVAKQNAEGVQIIREEYPRVNEVLNDVESKMNTAETDMDFEVQEKRIETYKGTVFENMVKDQMQPLFESVEDKQEIVETSLGDTKPDIVCRDAKEDFMIGDTEVKKGEDLFCEVKCGNKEYIESEFNHIEKQVRGHQEGKSVVIVTKDYLEIDPTKRALFESKLREYDSSVCVVDVKAEDVERGIFENIFSR